MRLPLLTVFAAASISVASSVGAADAASAPAATSAPASVSASAPAAAVTAPAVGPIAAVPADKAQIVFLDPSNAVANAFPPAIYDITPGQPRSFLAKLGSKVNAAVLVTPGHHLLMVRTFAVSQYFDATVEAGHRYYVLARFVYGRGFQLRPLRPGAGAGKGEYSIANPKFKDWVADGAWPARTEEYPAGTDLAKFNAALDEHQAGGLVDWNAKTAEQKAELTLTVADAFDQ